jgi:Xaa-Pro aminopeptidase
MIEPRKHARLTVSAVLAFTAFGLGSAHAQQGFTDFFPPEELPRGAREVIASIGDGVAIMQGTTERRGESPLRQSNQFFYLTGVVEPRAYLIVDGKRGAARFSWRRDPGSRACDRALPRRG